MNRRTNEVSGWVNFPVNDPDWKSTGEGGMVVKLVVCDTDDISNGFAQCCGGAVFDMLCEVMVGDDQLPCPPATALAVAEEDAQALSDAFDQDEASLAQWKARHFPNEGTDEGSLQYLSRDYLAVIVLGTTGWSGCHAIEGYWTCKRSDLTPEGLALYDQLQALYPAGRLHLLTFLDT